jgi:F420H(2)-dependent quinone reductase
VGITIRNSPRPLTLSRPGQYDPCVGLSGTYVPSATPWVREQVDLFERTNGSEGNTMLNLPIIIVTSRGAKSGSIRKTPLMRVEHESLYVAVASQGGSPTHPVWYYNLVAEPHCEVQDGANKSDRTARLLSGAERSEWWDRAVAAYPPYAEYQTKTTREIPVFLLEPRS